MSKIFLLIVEDHEIFSDALIDLLGKDDKLQIAGVARSAEECLKKLEGINVDLVLIDVSLPSIDGISLVKLIHDRFPNLLCLMISAYLSPEYVRDSLQAGALGYLIKDDPAAILEGIWSVVSGKKYISKEFDDIDLGFLPS